MRFRVSLSLVDVQLARRGIAAIVSSGLVVVGRLRGLAAERAKLIDQTLVLDVWISQRFLQIRFRGLQVLLKRGGLTDVDLTRRRVASGVLEPGRRRIGSES